MEYQAMSVWVTLRTAGGKSTISQRREDVEENQSNA